MPISTTQSKPKLSFLELQKDAERQNTLAIAKREDVARSRITFGVSSALALQNALKKSSKKNEVLEGYCYKLLQCAKCSNHWVGEDLLNKETGELYPANGVIKACGLKLCPSCVALTSKRSRKELMLSLKNQKLQSGENYNFITKTIPNPNLSLLLTRKIIYRADTLMRKREYSIKHIRGGVKSEEFTITENGFHYHIHSLCITKFLSFEQFRKEWTDCVRIAFEEFSILFEVKNKDGLLSVKIERVSSSQNSLKGAVQEVCKYITKSDSWEKLPEKDLMEIASIERFPRMFELFGYFRFQRTENEILNFRQPFITYLIKYLLINAVLQILEYLKKEIEKLGQNAILDTKEISDGNIFDFAKFSGNSPPNETEKRQRQLNWRRHIENFGLKSYQVRHSDETELASEYRRFVLKTKHPYATFWTLAGEAI